MKYRPFLKQVLALVIPTVVLFALVEIPIRIAYRIRNSLVDSVPLAYVVGDDYGPVPPWADDLHILVPDNTLIWKNRTNVHRRYLDVFSPVQREEDRAALFRQFIPSIPASLKEKPVWEVSLNSEGFRDDEFPAKETHAAFRVMCVGDSWTFGANVGQNQAYPQQFQALLRNEFPGKDIEVFNLGVLGYSSYQGLQLLKKRIDELRPNVVVIGFGMNDSSMAGYRDRDMPQSREKSPTFLRQMVALATNLQSFKLLRYWVDILKYKPVPLGERMKPQKTPAKDDPAHSWKEKYDEEEPFIRVSLADYEKNLVEMIKLARDHQADAILLDNQLWSESPYIPVLRKVSTEERVPFVDSLALIDNARTRIEKDLETKLHLETVHAHEAKPPNDVEVVFRVYTGDIPVPKGVYIVGPHPNLGSLVPNRVAMYDDGTHGDQKAGDKVWSYTATFPQGTDVLYMYTNSGQEGKWDGLDVPAIREFSAQTQENEERVYNPIESFGRLYMQADGWHTNAEGYQLMAHALVDVLKEGKKIK